MGILLAYAYARTFSIWIPFVIHFGWNMTQNFIFQEASTGNLIFILAAPLPLIPVSYIAFFTLLLLPKIAILSIDFLIVKQFRQVELT